MPNEPQPLTHGITYKCDKCDGKGSYVYLDPLRDPLTGELLPDVIIIETDGLPVQILLPTGENTMKRLMALNRSELIKTLSDAGIEFKSRDNKKVLAEKYIVATITLTDEDLKESDDKQD